MGRSKKVLKLCLLSFGMHCVIGNHQPYYNVKVSLGVEDEPGRYADWEMTPDEAERMGNGLIEYAEKVRKHNAQMEESRRKEAERQAKR